MSTYAFIWICTRGCLSSLSLLLVNQMICSWRYNCFLLASRSFLFHVIDCGIFRNKSGVTAVYIAFVLGGCLLNWHHVVFALVAVVAWSYMIYFSVVLLTCSSHIGGTPSTHVGTCHDIQFCLRLVVLLMFICVHLVHSRTSCVVTCH